MHPQTSRHAVLFDFDGTLGHSLPHWTSAYQECLHSHGVTMDTRDVIEACFTRRQSDVLADLKIEDHNSFHEGVWERVKQRMPFVESFADLHDLLQSLRAHSHVLGVVTNSRRGHVAPVLERWELASHFDVFVAIEDVANGKPHPEPIERALELLRIPASNAWMIGDSLVDIHAGKAAGVKTIAFSPPENHPFVDTETLRAAEPTHVARSNREIANIILPPERDR